MKGPTIFREKTLTRAGVRVNYYVGNSGHSLTTVKGLFILRQFVMEKLRFIFLFICCLPGAVGPLNFLQVVAWGNMIHDRSEDRSIVEAADMTFFRNIALHVHKAIIRHRFSRDFNRRERT